MSTNEIGDLVCDICHEVKTGPIASTDDDTDICMDCLVSEYMRLRDDIALWESGDIFSTHAAGIYEALRKENETLKAELEEWKECAAKLRIINADIFEDRKKLRAQLEVAEEGLNDAIVGLKYDHPDTLWYQRECWERCEKALARIAQMKAK